MAALLGHFDYWNTSSEDVFQNIWRRGNIKAVSATIAVPAIVMSPIIVFGNSLVILSVLKDPLKKLRSSPSNYILLSMAIADLLIGLLLCPLNVYLGVNVFYHYDPPFLPLAVGAFFTPVSIGHVFLLTIDRFLALVTPLHYRVKVTNRRVCMATVTCWIYCILCGCAFYLLREHYIIMGTFYNLQIFLVLLCMIVMYAVLLCRFHSYSKSARQWNAEQSNSNRQQIFQREKNLSRAIAIVICAFLVCFMPWFIVQIIIYVCLSCQHNLSLLLLFYALTANLVHTNSGVNPFLYAWRLPKYRDTFKYFLKKRIRCCGDENRQDPENHVHDTRL